MTFTYTEDLTVDVDFVRFHSGDTMEAESLLSDEIIASLVTKYELNRAVIEAMEYQLSQVGPDFKADWLQISAADWRAAKERAILRKRQTLNVPRVTATAKHVWRADSAATEEPDFTDGRP